MRYVVVRNIRLGNVRLLIHDDETVWYSGNDIMDAVGYARRNFRAYFHRNGVMDIDTVKIGDVRAKGVDGNITTLLNFGWAVNRRGLETFFDHCNMPRKDAVREWLLNLGSKRDRRAELAFKVISQLRTILIGASEDGGRNEHRYLSLLGPLDQVYRGLKELSEEGGDPC